MPGPLNELTVLVDEESPTGAVDLILPGVFHSRPLISLLLVEALRQRRPDIARFGLRLRALAVGSLAEFVAQVGSSVPELHVAAGISPKWAPDFVGLEVDTSEWPQPPASAHQELLDMLCISAALGDQEAVRLLSVLAAIPPKDLHELLVRSLAKPARE